MSDKPIKLRDQVAAAFESVEESHSEPEVAEDVSESPSEDTSSSESEHESAQEADSSASEKSDDDLEPPIHWTKEHIENFKELDAKAQRLYLKRHKEMEAGYTKKSQSLAEEKKTAERFKKAIESHEDHLKNLGVDPFVAVNRLLETERLLRVGTPHQKSQALQKIIQDYGIDVAQQIHSNQQMQQQQQHVDPSIQAIYEELNKQRQYIAQQEKSRVDQEVGNLQNQIDTFASSKDDKGELKYPHFEEVREQMGALIQIGQANNLENAYKKAIFLNDDLRDEHIMRQNRIKERDEADKKRLASSKKAGFNVKSGSVSQISDPKQTLTTRQILERAYDAQSRI